MYNALWNPAPRPPRRGHLWAEITWILPCVLSVEPARASLKTALNTNANNILCEKQGLLVTPMFRKR